MLQWPAEFWPSGFMPRGFFPDDARRHEVYSRPTVDGSDTLVAVVLPGDDAEATIAGAASSEQFVHARAFNRRNKPDLPDGAAVPLRRLTRFAFDEDGALILPVPNPPTGLQLLLRASGRVVARWGYSPVDQAAPVASFRVYVATGATPISYAAPTHTRTAGGRVVEQDLGTFADGTLVKVVVRSVAASGAEESNTSAVEINADAAAPAAPAGLVVEVTEE